MGSTRDLRNHAVSLLITEPFIRFNNFHEKIRTHAASGLHRKNFQMVNELYGWNPENESLENDDTSSDGDDNTEVLEMNNDSSQLS